IFPLVGGGLNWLSKKTSLSSLGTVGKTMGALNEVTVEQVGNRIGAGRIVDGVSSGFSRYVATPVVNFANRMGTTNWLADVHDAKFTTKLGKARALGIGVIHPE